MSGAVWWVEWQIALRRRRLFVLNLAIPLVLVVPIALGGAPPFHAAAAYAVLFVLFGTFGSAIPLLRDAEEGTLRRILLTGTPSRSILLPRAVAGTALDCLQLLPATAVIVWLGGGTWDRVPLLVVILAGALLVANLVGIWVAAGARSLAEGALFAAVVALFLLHGSSVFRTPAPGSVGALLETLLPFAPIHHLLLEAAGGAPMAITVPAALLSTFGGGAVLMGVTALAAGSLMERIAPAIRKG